MFMFQLASRRKGNAELTGPQLLENLRALFPDLEDMPHQDTLCRLLQNMDVDQIEDCYLDLLRCLIRRKKFRYLLRKNRYLVATDGIQKYVMKDCWDERYLHRRIQGKDGEWYYAYVLEAVLVFTKGMVLPLIMSLSFWLAEHGRFFECNGIKNPDPISPGQVLIYRNFVDREAIYEYSRWQVR